MFTEILVFGAGRSSTVLIEYLLHHAPQLKWRITVADIIPGPATAKLKGNPHGKAIEADVRNQDQCFELVKNADLVISMLPAFLHIFPAKACIHYKKNMVTASYWAKDLQTLEKDVIANNLLFIGELGLDPGIDHMSAKQKIDEIHEQGGKIKVFRSYTGGLISPECNDNPWNYKFTWNPRNVVLAGKDGARFLKSGMETFLPYEQLFKSAESIHIPEWGTYEVYPNRDSLHYRQIYELWEAEELVRGTIRNEGYCEAWNVLIDLGLTDEKTKMQAFSAQDFLFRLFPEKRHLSFAQLIRTLVTPERQSAILPKLEWLELESAPVRNEMVLTPAEWLENILLEKWQLKPEDKDLILMLHEMEYVLEGETHLVRSRMAFQGENAINTAMTQLVGLPVGIFVKHFLLGNIQANGMVIPIDPKIYTPILNELKSLGVIFIDQYM